MSVSSDAEHERIRERRKMVVALRLAGLPWEEIAERAGVSSAAAARVDYTRARDKSIAELNASVEELRSVEVDRLDRLQAALWPRAVGGDIKAVDSCVRIIERRAKMLGLEAPTKVDLQGRIDVESRVVVDVVMAVVESLGLEPAERMRALDAAQSQLMLIGGSNSEETA